MGRKKNLADIDEYDKGFIDAAMKQSIPISAECNNYQTSRFLDYKLDIKCKNKKQKDFLKLLKDESKMIVIGSGAAGSGKSWVAYSYALSQLKDTDNNIDQIVVFIPCAQAGSKEISLGYLKGTIEDKTLPFCEASTYTMEKILRNSGNFNAKEIIDSLKKLNLITFNFLNFARGKTIDNSIIILEESENISSSEMLLLLTRIGENSKIVIIGSEEQKDRKDLKYEKSGMLATIENLSDMEEFGHVEFTNDDVVRNPIISKIIENWKITV